MQMRKVEPAERGLDFVGILDVAQEMRKKIIALFTRARSGGGVGSGTSGGLSLKKYQ